MGRIIWFFLVATLLISLPNYPKLVTGVETNVSIDNSPPMLIQSFDNISLLENTDSINYLDLDDYFIDYNGDTMTFGYSVVNNVTITIDSQGNVSFYPDTNYQGTQTMYFTASDNYTTVQGNTFYLIVGADTTPPQWSNPQKNRQTVYQSSNVDFTSLWTDDVSLNTFIFSINEGNGWLNQTPGLFSGVFGISEQSFQISASEGALVLWRFYANDTSGNINTTAIQNFTVGSFTGSGSGSGGGSGSGSGSSSTYGAAGDALEQTYDFTVNVKNLKVSLRQGDTQTKVVRIKNTGTLLLNFQLILQEISFFTKLNEYTFSLEPGETRDILVEFTIPEDATPDQYFGSLDVQANDLLKIPIVIDVRKFESEFEIDVNVTDKTIRKKGGKPVEAIISIKSIKDVRPTKLILVYSIKDFNGNILGSAKEEITMESLFEETRSLTIPEKIYEGEYIFYGRITGAGVIDLDSDTFFTGPLFKFKEILNYLLLLLLIIIILTLIYVYLRNKRKRKLLELYLLMNELRKLIKEGKLGPAAEVYKRIKVTYGQHVPGGLEEDPKKLRIELEKFSKILSTNPSAGMSPEKSPPPKAKILPKTLTKTQTTATKTTITPTPPKKISPATKLLPVKPLSLSTKKSPPPLQKSSPGKLIIPPKTTVVKPTTKPTTPTKTTTTPTTPKKTSPVQTQKQAPVPNTKEVKDTNKTEEIKK